MTEFDRTGRGFPNFGYRLRKLEQRVRLLETQLAMTTSSDRPDEGEDTGKVRDGNRTAR